MSPETYIFLTPNGVEESYVLTEEFAQDWNRRLDDLRSILLNDSEHDRLLHEFSFKPGDVERLSGGNSPAMIIDFDTFLKTHFPVGLKDFMEGSVFDADGTLCDEVWSWLNQSDATRMAAEMADFALHMDTHPTATHDDAKPHQAVEERRLHLQIRPKPGDQARPNGHASAARTPCSED
ncbi:hypothetical protein K461DRAFT_22458 [Myriangium duriaei CBS 260.36]|uniref:Uncharacterized protein n=1 Tax=Myriangium duriaei CBS 260.36 TaxID=1168546 RepID=A0A9P4J991_9PEZI|nr:hypothetical protein K461DRAFT_22458 [Myriangium duriaei CBS 260.36]